MKRADKRYISIALILCLCITMINGMFQNVNAASNIVINGIDIGYYSGSFFTKNEGPCKNSSFSNGRCHKHNICTAATDPRCNCMRYWPTGDPNNYQINLMASQCFGFSRYCQWKVYGYHDGNAASNFVDISGYLSTSSCTESALKSRLLGCAPATHIRLGTNSNGHSLTVISTSESSIKIAECNFDGLCQVREKTYTWANFATEVRTHCTDYNYNGIGYINSVKDGASSVPTAHNPFGVTDSVSGGIHSIHIRGWAFDQDDMSQSLNLHVYVGGIPYEIPANVYRPDVHNVHGCGEYHGFDATIYVDTSLVGTQTVEIYALNVGGGQHALLHSTAVNIEKDSSAPTISNVVVSDISPSGYTVTCTVTDESEISRVQFPTWTSKNGQDDLFAEWPTNPAAAGTKNGNTYTYRVNVSDHNNESGEYVTHIYAFDKYSNHDADNSIVVEVPYNDTTPPKIYSVYADDISSDGYTLYCKVSDDGAIDRVMFPTWTTYHGQDDLPNDWRDNSTVMGIENNGVYSCRVNASDHNNETGEYHTHIYAYDKAGNETCYGDFVVHLPVKAIPGDLNNDSNVTNDDVIVLLWHTLFPEENPISANADFNKDKIITNDDVLLLLWHTLFPENNPL